MKQMKYNKDGTINYAICQECKAFLRGKEFINHPFEHCILAKKYPNTWRKKLENK